MYAEYLEQGLAPLQGDLEADSQVATALLFGIQTDTDDFALASGADFAAAAYLKPFCDVALLRRFGHRTLDAKAMDAVGSALQDLEVVRDFAMAGVGRVSANNRDAMAIAADFILRREDIDTVLVYGIVKNRIDGSLRTTSPSIDPAEFLATAFGKDANGRPYGGGRADKGGFQIPLGVLADAADTDTIWHMVKQVVREKLKSVVPDLDPDA
jgi:nanoRNase/pAp phosphatase (c-di-AMP/oligoRNAs hydrolase)